MKAKTNLALTVMLVAGALVTDASYTFAHATDAAKVASPAKAMVMPEPAPNFKPKKLRGKIEREVVEGEELMGKGKYAEAADHFRDAIAKNSKNASAYAGLGIALAKQFKLDGAEEQLDKSMAIDPNNALAHMGKAIVLINRLQSSSATIQRNRDSMLKQAENECRDALRLDPYSPEGHYYLGQALKEQGRIDESANEFNEAVKSDPKSSDAYAGLGMAKLLQNSYAEAASNFKQAITLNSGNSTAHYGLGRAYLKQGMVDEAIKELNTSLYQFPNSAPARLTMGEAYNAQGNTVAAVKEYQESIRIKPENAEAYLHIADIRESRGDLEHSIAELRSGLELMPNNPELHSKIADECLRLEKVDDAIKEYTNVMNTNPQDAVAAKGITRAYFLKAQKEAGGAFLLSNDYESARKQLAKAVALNPNDMELRLADAKLRAMSGEKVDLSQVGTPKTDGERVAYAEALLAENKFKEAQDQMNMAIGSANTTKQTFAIADLALMIKDLDSAEFAYRKAASMPEGADRAKRGLDMVATARESSRQDLTLATDLSKKGQIASAVDKYHSAIFGNPRVADARMGLGKTLERVKPTQPKDLREAAVQYRAYIALSPSLPPKEVEKLQKKITKLDEKAFKIEQKQQQKQQRH